MTKSTKIFVAIDPQQHKIIKDIFALQCPIVHGGISYLRIRALIYVYSDKGTKLNVQLLDKNERCIVEVPAETLIRENSDIVTMLEAEDWEGLWVKKTS